MELAWKGFKWDTADNDLQEIWIGASQINLALLSKWKHWISGLNKAREIEVAQLVHMNMLWITMDYVVKLR